MKITGEVIVGFCCITVLSLSVMSQDTHRLPHGNIQWECETCHASKTGGRLREPLAFRHEETGFPLLGSHENVECTGCHNIHHFSHVGVTCADCHADVHEGQLGFECQRCHTPQDWEDRQGLFEIHAASGFFLEGVHALTDCDACHRRRGQEEYIGVPKACKACHIDTFMAARDPDHIRAGFTPDCQACHWPAAMRWTYARFEHSSAFELQGAHGNIECLRCHRETYAGTRGTCYGCHDPDYRAADDPPHLGAGFPTDCVICHTSESWDRSGESPEFGHAETGFPLVGAHEKVRCSGCHRTDAISRIRRECVDCHTDIHRGQLGSECQMCHTPRDWENREDVFEMHTARGFSLEGVHAVVDCDACHRHQGREEYVGTPVDCQECHIDHYRAARNPDHIGAGFGLDCQQCHSSAGLTWENTSYEHPPSFELRGGHRTLECIQCHGDDYVGLSNQCYGCHESDYLSATDPAHSDLGFPTDCEICHGDQRWEGAVYDHDLTHFPLTGAHAVLECKACHERGYTGTPTDCFSCHERDYTSASHQAAGFPVDCQSCHNTVAWNQTTWDHDTASFPIYSGEHSGQWDSCTDCHSVPGDYSVFECIYCHAHRQNKMDAEHRDVSGYIYTSTACYGCHPSGNR